jgi:hypothetical protein
MLKISSGKEEGFHYLQEWFAASAAVEQDAELMDGDGDGMGMPGECCTDNMLSPPASNLRTRAV